MKRFIGIIVCLLLIGMFVSVVLLRQRTPEAPAPLPIPTPFPTKPAVLFPTPVPVEQSSEPNESFLNNLPYKTDAFIIEYYAPEKTIIVTLSQSPIEQGRDQANAWMREHGLSFENNRILYIHSRYAN